MEREPVSVVFIDDHRVFLEGLVALSEHTRTIRVCGTATNAANALELVRNERPQVVVLDVDLGDGEPAERTIRRLLRAVPESRVVILTMVTYPPQLDALIRAGATTCLNKNTSSSELLQAIAHAASAKSQAPACASKRAPSPVGLTHRESEVLRLVSLAITNKRIADDLCITEGTVKRHLHDLYRKLGASNRLDAVRKAQATGLLP